LLVLIGFVADFAATPAQQQRPLAVAFAVVVGQLVGLRVVDASALLLLDHRHLLAGRRLVKVRKVGRHRGTRDVVDLHCQHADASALVAERKIHALLVHGNALRLHIDVHVRVVVEATLACCDPADELVALGLPRRWLARLCIELVKEQAERLLAAQRVARKERAVANGEVDLDVESVGGTAIDERRPQPVVDVRISDIADDVAAPVDALAVIGERLLNPLHASERKERERK
jgi:hypothetical protein